MNDFEQCLPNFIFGQFPGARKLIINGGAIRPTGLLLMLWRTFYVMAYFLLFWRTFYVLAYFFISWLALLCFGLLFYVLAYFVYIFDALAYF